MGDQIYLPTSEGAAREGTGHVSEDSPQPGHWLEAENGDPRTLLEDFLANHALPLKIKSSLPFFPPDVLQALFTPKVIEEKLSRVCAERGIVRHVKGDVQRIIGRDPDAKAGTLEKSWLKIFALLVLVQRESDIFFWIDSELGISDGDLPLVYKSKSFYLDRSSTTPLRHFGNWDLSNLRAFDRKQWQVKVPVFTSGETDPLPHRDFEEREILPFLDVKDKDGTWYPEMLGGYGTVECVRLPSSCYDFTSRYGEGKVPDTNGLFALKTLLNIGGSKVEEMFNREREMLKRFGDLHEHIIALLATFTQKGSHYLLFPWAECDLFDFWKNTTPRHDHETVLWIAEQCLQLVNALHEIHYVRKTPDLKRFGRHGDIKSENVLVFPNPAGGSGHGKLVLADMGCSSVHREISISAMSNNRVQSTLQYRPPECDIRGAKITRAFDIWTLGCLLLDMCTWWLGGWDLIEEFKLERFERDKVVDYKTGPKSDVYFEMRRYENSEDEHILVKESVTEWFQELRAHNGCTQYMSDFLDLIEKKMIIVEPRHRKSRGPENREKPGRIRTESLKQELKSLLEKCGDESYALSPKPGKQKEVEL